MRRRGGHESGRMVLVGTLALGLLIWAKLRLVTTIPRSALADPEISRRASTSPETGPSGTNPSRPKLSSEERAVAEVPGTEPTSR